MKSWGNYPKVEPPSQIFSPSWTDEIPKIIESQRQILPYGNGRSYGDSCLNSRGALLQTRHLQRILHFDSELGIVTCEPGVLLSDLLEVFLPQGWFLPVTPGTQFITVGGAVANDVHGKNHHVAGTFGHHVVEFDLLRSNGTQITCSPTQNESFFRATIGGLGLTGFISRITFRMKKVAGPWVESETIKTKNLDEFFRVSEESDQRWEYTVSWIDSMARGPLMGRGLFSRGNHSDRRTLSPKRRQVSIPLNFPEWSLNAISMSMFNTLYYHKQRTRSLIGTVPFEPFFYPLDAVHNWNRVYGRRGLLQYQFVLPLEQGYEGVKAIFEKISESRMGSFLTVLKKFGSLPSPGILSFPRPGYTGALDFPNYGAPVLQLLNQLDELVYKYNGALYPAKDARMSSKMFMHSHPRVAEFLPLVDPAFSSNFFRRVSVR